VGTHGLLVSSFNVYRERKTQQSKTTTKKDDYKKLLDFLKPGLIFKTSTKFQTAITIIASIQFKISFKKINFAFSFASDFVSKKFRNYNCDRYFRFRKITSDFVIITLIDTTMGV